MHSIARGRAMVNDFRRSELILECGVIWSIVLFYNLLVPPPCSVNSDGSYKAGSRHQTQVPVV